MSTASPDEKSIPSPDEKFTLIFVRHTRGWATINAMRRVAQAGMPSAAEVLYEQQQSVVEKMADGLRKSMTDEAIRNASCSVDAASIVFAHSILDDMLNSFLEITTDVYFEFWARRVGQRMVKLEALTQSSVCRPCAFRQCIQGSLDNSQ